MPDNAVATEAEKDAVSADTETTSEMEAKPTQAPKQFLVQMDKDSVHAIATELGESVSRLSAALGMPVVFLVQNIGPSESILDMVSDTACDGLQQFIRTHVDRNQQVAVIVHSRGGHAHAAYKFARFLQKYCGGYTAIIPRYAKSAATLFALGTDRLIMGEFAEIGPLDVQLSDPDREEHMSALEVVQSVERLNTESLTAIDVQMTHWVKRSGKKVEYLLPVASHFVSEMMRPLFEKIDAVQFTSMSRLLRVAQDYAERLLRRQYQKDSASQIASTLTEKYSDHGFVIDREEAERIGLRCEALDDDLADIIDKLSLVLPDNKRMLGVFGEHQERHDDQA